MAIGLPTGQQKPADSPWASMYGGYDPGAEQYLRNYYATSGGDADGQMSRAQTMGGGKDKFNMAEYASRLGYVPQGGPSAAPSAPAAAAPAAGPAGGGGPLSSNMNAGDPNNPFFGTGAVGIHPNQAPSYPRYRSAVNPDNGKVQDAYSFQSQWLPMAQRMNNAQTAESVNRATGLGSQNAANAWSKLASNGGLSSGAKERIAYNANRDTTNAVQELFGKRNTTNLGLQADAAKADIGNAIGDLGNSNQYNLGLFQQMAQMYGAKQTANGMRANAGPKNLFGGDAVLIPGLL